MRGELLLRIVLEVAVGTSTVNSSRRSIDAGQNTEFTFAGLGCTLSTSRAVVKLLDRQQSGETGWFEDIFLDSRRITIIFLFLQGMFTQYAEGLWNKITEHVSDIKYSLKQTILGLESFNKTFWIRKLPTGLSCDCNVPNVRNLQIFTENPRLSKIIMLDALVSHLYVIYWSEKEGVKTAATSGTVTPTKNTSASSPSEFIPPSPESTTTTLEASKSTGTDETKAMPVTTNDELVKELMTKALNALETIKECVL